MPHVDRFSAKRKAFFDSCDSTEDCILSNYTQCPTIRQWRNTENHNKKIGPPGVEPAAGRTKIKSNYTNSYGLSSFFRAYEIDNMYAEVSGFHARLLNINPKQIS